MALSQSLCTLLGVASGAQVALTPVSPLTCILRTRSSNSPLHPSVVTVSTPVTQHIHSDDKSLILVPTSYVKTPHVIGIAPSDIEPILDDSEAVIEVHSSVYESLACEGQPKILAYSVPDTAETRIQLTVLRHPGWAYLTEDAAHRLGVSAGSSIELQKSRRRAVVQVFSVSAQERYGAISVVDASAGNALGLRDAASVLAYPTDARLFWVRRHSLDDIRSKARAVVTITTRAAEKSGYLNGELVDLLAGSHRGRAYVECAAANLRDDELTMTPLLMRSLEREDNDGILVKSDPSGRMLARVGILNVDEVGKLAVKGSAHLDTHFRMPCLVQLRNPLTAASLDIRMEADPYNRSEAMVRMARSTRDILSLERGAEVLVSAIGFPPLGTVQRCKSVFVKLQFKGLNFLIGSRPIHMSIAPGQLWDDEAQVARTSRETLALLGVAEGERVRVSYRNHSISRVILARKTLSRTDGDSLNDDPQPHSTVSPDMQLNLDALGRYALGQGHVEFGTVVTVERDLRFFFKRSLNLSILSTVGAVITVVALFRSKPMWLQLIAGACVVAVYFYLALSVERSKVR